MNNNVGLRFKQQWQHKGTVDLIYYAQLLFVVGAYYVLSHFIFDSVVLSESSYRQPIIALEALRYPSVLVVFLPCLLLLIINYVNVGQNPFFRRSSWEQYRSGEQINVKYLIFAIALVLAWAFSVNEFNFYYGEAFYVDRLLLVILAFLILINPLFVPIFLLFTFIYVSQYNYPEFINYSWFDKKLLFKILLLFSIFVFASLFVRFRPSMFLFLSLCIVGSDYLYAGTSKLFVGGRPIDWMLKNRLHNLFVSSYVNGWLTFIDQPTILQTAAIMRFLDIPLQVYTLIFELGGILLVAGRRISTAVLVGAILLHVGIFLSSGIFFWKWIVLDAGLVFVLWKYRGEIDRRLFTRSNALFSIALIFFGYIYFSQTSTGWFDTRVNNFYDFEAVDENGDVYNIPRGLWAPYDLPFAQDNFYFLNESKVLVGTYGTQGNLGLANAINRAETAEEIEAVWEQYGAVRYSEATAQGFDDFVRTFIRNMNSRMDSTVIPLVIHPPHHITTFFPENPYVLQAPIRTVRIRLVETFYNDSEIIVLENKLIREINIYEDE